MSKNLKREASDLDQLLDAEALTDEEARAVHRSLPAALRRHRRASKLRWAWSAVPVAAAAGVALFFAWPTQPVGFQLIAGNGCAQIQSQSVRISETCTTPVRVGLGADVLEVTPGTDLVREKTAVRIRRGRARLVITDRPSTATPFEVRVSHGRIYVLGTVFTVHQGDNSGWVAVEAGSVKFQSIDGTTTQLEAGERLAWPREAQRIDPDPEPDSSLVDAQTKQEPTPRANDPLPTVSQALKRLLVLRTQGRHQEAIRLLRRVSARRDLSRTQKERLRFELLSSRQQLSGLTEEICGAWTRHLEQFPGSPRAAHIRSLLEECDK